MLLTAGLIISAIAIAVGLGVRLTLGARGPVYVEQRRPGRRDAR